MHDKPDGSDDRVAAVGDETLAPRVRLEEFEIRDELGAGVSG